jgi:hypothetical protein
MVTRWDMAASRRVGVANAVFAPELGLRPVRAGTAVSCVRRLLAAQTISPLGDAMAATALILHVPRTTGRATAVGLLLLVQAIPPLAAPLAGVIADRSPPGRPLSFGWLRTGRLAG